MNIFASDALSFDILNLSNITSYPKYKPEATHTDKIQVMIKLKERLTGSLKIK